MKCALFQCRRVTHIAHRASNKQMLEVRKKKKRGSRGGVKKWWKKGARYARRMKYELAQLIR